MYEISPSGLPGTILLVAEEQDVRFVLGRMLHAAGHTVIEAEGGTQALLAAGSHGGPIDLLVTSVVMARMNGFHLAERLVEQHKDLKVVYLTQIMREAIRKHRTVPVKDVPLAEFLKAPVDPAGIVCRVAEELAQKQRPVLRLAAGVH